MEGSIKNTLQPTSGNLWDPLETLLKFADDYTIKVNIDPTEIVNAFANLFDTHEFSHATCAVKLTSDTLAYVLSLISAEEVIKTMSAFPNVMVLVHVRL